MTETTTPEPRPRRTRDNGPAVRGAQAAAQRRKAARLTRELSQMPLSAWRSAQHQSTALSALLTVALSIAPVRERGQ